MTKGGGGSKKPLVTRYVISERPLKHSNGIYTILVKPRYLGAQIHRLAQGLISPVLVWYRYTSSMEQWYTHTCITGIPLSYNWYTCTLLLQHLYLTTGALVPYHWYTDTVPHHAIPYRTSNRRNCLQIIY